MVGRFLSNSLIIGVSESLLSFILSICLPTFYQLRVVSLNCGMLLDNELQKFKLYWAKLGRAVA
jgi:hypothetical protein